jgi:hypothetical protein
MFSRASFLPKNKLGRETIGNPLTSLNISKFVCSRRITIKVGYAKFITSHFRPYVSRDMDNSFVALLCFVILEIKGLMGSTLSFEKVI